MAIKSHAVPRPYVANVSAAVNHVAKDRRP